MNSKDRCDGCGSQAYVRVTNKNMELDFCGHHFTKLEKSLDSQGWVINMDTRELLTRRAEKAEVK